MSSVSFEMLRTSLSRGSRLKSRTLGACLLSLRLICVCHDPSNMSNVQATDASVAFILACPAGRSSMGSGDVVQLK